MKTKYKNHTAHELIESFTKIGDIIFITKEENSILIEHFQVITPPPEGLGLTLCIEAGIAKDPQNLIRIVNEWRLPQGKPGSKSF
ncbi:bacteriocin immunity protein [Pseudomonas lundensis]|nr:bacteriocin immunity protein [Pseudomonas lundensis]